MELTGELTKTTQVLERKSVFFRRVAFDKCWASQLPPFCSRKVQLLCLRSKRDPLDPCFSRLTPIISSYSGWVGGWMGVEGGGGCSGEGGAKKSGAYIPSRSLKA